MLQDEWFARSHTEFWRGIVLTPFLLQGWSPNLATFGNTVAWTLSSEVMFYLAFPFLLYAWAKRAAWLNTPGRLIGLFFALWLFGLVPHLLYTVLNPDHLAAPADRYTSTHLLRFLKYTPPPYVCTFLAGVTLGKLHPLVPFTSRQRLLVAVTALTLLGFFFYTGAAHRAPYIFMHGGLLTPLFCLLILGLAGPNLISARYSPFAPWSFSGAKLPSPSTSAALQRLRPHPQPSCLPQRLHLAAYDPWISYLLLLLIAYVAFRFVENPSRKLILRRFSRKPKPAANPI